MHTGKSVEARRVRLERGGRTFFVNMVARPFRDPEAGDEFVLVLFDEVEDTLSAEATGGESGERDAVILHLEEELHRTKERLQATIEQSETSTEELKASNEELQAINEELRSATEELETSKEELQSVNEELITVNYELKTKVDETAKANDDLRNFIASTDIASVFVDAGLRIRRFTPRAEDIFSLIPADVGRSLLDITHRLDYPELAADATQAFEALRPVEREVRSMDGRLYVARVLPYRTQENRIDGAVLTFIDVTRLRQAQEQVDRAQDQLRVAAASAANHAIVVFDEDHRITAWNSGAQRLFGHAPDEAIGQPLSLLCTGGEAGDWLADEIATAERDGCADIECGFARRDAGRAVCTGMLTPLSNDSFRGFVLVVSDGTRRIADQERAQVELDRAVSQRARIEAESALKDDFLAVMSHELKNPLNLISVNAEMLARTPAVRADAHAVDSVDAIRRAIRGQGKIIDDLLDMSRIRTGKLRLNVTAVDLCALVESIVEVARADSAAAALEIQWECPAEHTIVRADIARIEQVIWNLLGNAIKFTPAGGTVRLTVANEQHFCRLSVSDTGQGIDPAFLPRIFELFNQAPGRALSASPGLGIGLAVVRELVVLHGGRIEARSDGAGRGARFDVWIPRVMPERATRRAVPAPDQGDIWTGLRILIVDDTREGVDALARLLELEGASVVRAYGGAQALELLAAHEVDVVLSDLGMPGMDGYELARRIRADARLQRLPLVAVTGFGRDGDARRSREAGFDAHIGKPILPETLAEVVAAVLGGEARPAVQD